MKYNMTFESESFEDDLSNIIATVTKVVDKYLTSSQVTSNQVKMENLEKKMDSLDDKIDGILGSIREVKASASFEQEKLKSLQQDFREVKEKVETSPKNK